MTDRFIIHQHHIDLIMVEDSADDAELITDSLTEAGLVAIVRRVDNEPALLAALDERLPAAILSDWTLPDFSGQRALDIAKKRCPDVPFIFVSGTISESTAFEALRNGAVDYVFKHQLQHLCPALTRSLNEAGAERALRESEHRLRTLLQTIPDLIWLKDSDGVYLSCNRMFERFFGAKEADIIGKTDYDFVSKEQADFFREHDRKAMAAGESSSNEEWISFADDGRRALLDVIKTPMFDPNGSPIGVLGIGRDITEKKALETQLFQAQKMEAIGQLAGGIAHDFNNIITGIIGFSTLIEMKMDKDDPQRENLNHVLVAADRAAELTKSLLAFSRKQIINPQPVDLIQIINKTEKFLKRIIGEDIDFRMISHQAVLTVNADGGQIEQVLMNLATNARDAMPNGGMLSIETSSVEMDADFIKNHGYGEPGEYALVSISDNGMGMDDVTRKRLFEPFFTTKEVGKGTGLGLSIVFGIVKQHNGYINVYSEPDVGTTFTLYLPLLKTETLKKPIIDDVPLKGGTETVLVADDDAVVLNLIVKILNNFGYTVITAVDGLDAVDKFNENKEMIALIILDVIMPKMNGKEAFDAIVKIRPEIKTIFISGYTADIIHYRGMLDEGLEFIDKPLRPMKLVQKVREVLDKT